MSSPNAHGLTSRQSSLVVVAIVSIIAPTVAVGLRLLSRRLVRASLWWDDYLAILALLFAYGPAICNLLSVSQGFGRHVHDLDPSHIVSILKGFYALMIMWTINFGLCYVTIVLLYIRLFPRTKLQTASICMGAIGVLATISLVGLLIWQCTPIAFYWDKTIPGGHCIKQSEASVACLALIVVLIFILFFLPAPTILGLHMGSTKKWGLVLTFSIGLFVCLTSLIHLIQVTQIDQKDYSWSAAPALLWCCLEASFGVVAACLPSLRPLIRMMWEGTRTRRGTDPSYSDRSPSKQTARRFSRAVHQSDPTATFSERDDLALTTRSTPDSHDDIVKLVNVDSRSVS